MKSKLTCVLILGMHRSGTSCLTGTLCQYGLYLGKVSKKNPFNIKGNHENSEIILLHNNLLKHNNGSWAKPPSHIKWTKNHLKKQKEIIYGYVKYTKTIGIKDPRLLITLSFWEHACTTIKYIGIFRHPVFVAESLYNRNKIPINQGLRLWYIYNTELLKLVTNKKFPVLSFDVSKEKFIDSVHKSLNYLGLSYSKIDKSFYNEDLIHHKNETMKNSILPPQIINLYNNLEEIYKSQSYDY